MHVRACNPIHRSRPSSRRGHRDPQRRTRFHARGGDLGAPVGMRSPPLARTPTDTFTPVTMVRGRASTLTATGVSRIRHHSSPHASADPAAVGKLGLGLGSVESAADRHGRTYGILQSRAVTTGEHGCQMQGADDYSRCFATGFSPVQGSLLVTRPPIRRMFDRRQHVLK